MADKADQLAATMYLCTETEQRVIMTGHRDGASCAQFVDYLLGTRLYKSFVYVKKNVD